MDAIERRGDWWWPVIDDNNRYYIPDEDTVGGILSFDPIQGASLELIGGLGRDNNEDSGSTSTIHGKTTDGELITLIDCRLSNERTEINDTHARSQEYTSPIILIGNLFDQDSVFYSMSISIQSLDRWTNERGLSGPEVGPVPSGPAKTSECILSDVDIVLEMWENIGSRFPTYPKPTSINIYPSTQERLPGFIDYYLTPLQNFITFGIGNASFPTSISVYYQQYGHRESRIQVYYQNQEFREGKKNINPRRMNFTLQEINFQKSIENWFRSFENSARLHHNFFSAQYNESMYLDTEFLSFVFGLESYHRDHFPQHYMDQDDFESVRDNVIDMIPDVAARSRMKDVIRTMGNEYSLKDRLMHIFSDRQTILSPIFNLEDTARDARDLRIDMAHGLDDEIDTMLLGHTTEKLRVAVSACFLKDIGISDSRAEDIVRSDYRDSITPSTF